MSWLRATVENDWYGFCSGHVLAFMAAYTKSRNDLNHSYIESPWIEESLKYCTLSFDFLSKLRQAIS